MSSVLARRSGTKRAYPVKAAATIAACVPVFLTAGIASDFDGADGTSKFAGVSTFAVDNSAGAVGAVKVEVEGGSDLIAFANAGDVVAASVGVTAYFTDAYTVSIDSDTDSRPIAGWISEVSDGLVWVRSSII